MKNLKQTLLGIALATAIMFSQNSNAQAKPKGKEWKVPAADAKAKSTVKFDDAAVAEGKTLWTQNCKSCHGVKGLGDGPKADKIDISCGNFSAKEFQSLTDGEIYYKTTEGRKPMPSFKEKLSNSERWQLVAFMRSLK
jgi:mono/diheme cytochrome c family protein